MPSMKKFNCTATLHLTVTNEIEALTEGQAKLYIERELAKKICDSSYFDYVTSTAELVEEPEEE